MPWPKGKSHSCSEETKKKIGDANRGENHALWGKHIPEETKKKMRASHRNRPSCSDETRRKISLSKMGNKNPMFGKVFSEETRRKMSESHKGKKSHLWRGGITESNDQIRSCFEYKTWARQCRKRDDFTCKHCLKRGGNLEVDHYPKTFSSIIRGNNLKSVEEAVLCKELWDLSNGRTLCKECHRKTETYGNRKNNYEAR